MFFALRHVLLFPFREILLLSSCVTIVCNLSYFYHRIAPDSLIVVFFLSYIFGFFFNFFIQCTVYKEIYNLYIIAWST